MKPVIAGVCGVVVGLVITGAFAALKISEARQSAGGTWRPVNTLAFTRELRPGTKISRADLKVRPLPEQFVTASFVRDDEAAKVIGRVLGVPVVEGDSVNWQHFDARAAEVKVTACAKAITESVKSAETATVEQAVRDFETRRPVPGRPPLLPPTPRDAQGEARITVASRDIAAGTTLTADMLAERTLPPYLITDSLVWHRDSSALIGARVLVSLQARDPVLWQQLDDRESPISAASCAFDATKVVAAARKKVAAERAAAYFTEVTAP